MAEVELATDKAVQAWLALCECRDVTSALRVELEEAQAAEAGARSAFIKARDEMFKAAPEFLTGYAEDAPGVDMPVHMHGMAPGA